MTRPKPIPEPAPMPRTPEGARAVPITGRRAGSRKAVIAWAFVDAEDYDLVMQHRWSFAGRGYVRTGRNSRYMHRVILGDEHAQVDHVNGNKLDNRRENLRPATNAQNHQAGSVRRPGVSGYRGVRRDRSKWAAHVTAHNVTYRKSGFATPEEAAAWRDEKAKEVHGEFFVPSMKEDA